MTYSITGNWKEDIKEYREMVFDWTVFKTEPLCYDFEDRAKVVPFNSCKQWVSISDVVRVPVEVFTGTEDDVLTYLFDLRWKNINYCNYGHRRVLGTWKHDPDYVSPTF